MRAIWRGEITFGLVAIPVQLFGAARDLSPRFHYLHKTCGTRIVMVRRCPYHDVDVPWSEIVKGYEVSKGRYAEFSKEELSKLGEEEGAEGIDLAEFVDPVEVEIAAIENSYWVGPAGKTTRAFEILREALERTGKAGIARTKIRTRTRLAMLRPREKRFALDLLRWPEELVPAKDVVVPTLRQHATQKELQLALGLIERMTTHFDATEHTDAYRRVIERAVEQKVSKGQLAEEKVQRREVEPGGKVFDLADLLTRSLQAPVHERAKPAAAHHTRRRARHQVKSNKRKAA